MTGRGWLIGAAVAAAVWAVPGDTRSQISNTGNCVVIVQGNWNNTTLNCSEPLPFYPPDPQSNHVWQTPGLAIGFEQGGKWVPIFTKDRKKLIVDLAPRPFTIWVPEDHWSDPNSDLPALQVSISWDPGLIDLPSRDLFAPGSGMADTSRGSGQLVLVDPHDTVIPHNYIIGHRFNRKMPHWRGVFISVIDTASPARNMITAATQGYAVFLMKENDIPKLPGVPPRAVPIDEASRDNVELNFAPVH